MSNRICVCVAGWHFPEATFGTLVQYSHVDVYVVSHQPRHKIPAFVFSSIPPDRVLIEPNYGYDWGCYQQFLEKGIWRSYKYVVFMHDDIKIKRNDFIEAGIALLRKHAVVGNGKNSVAQGYPRTHPESYFHASWRPSQSFSHDTVRGSFFMTTSKSLEVLEAFEVFWDRLHSTAYFGNWSTRASCAKWQDRCGPDCFGYLSNRAFESDWITEYCRGVEVRYIVERINIIQKIKAHLIYMLSRYYMQRRWVGGNALPSVPRMVETFLQYCASQPKKDD